MSKSGRIQGGDGKRITTNGCRHNHNRRTDAAGRRHLLVGWEYVHIAIDEATGLAHAEVLPDENATIGIPYMRRAGAPIRSYIINVQGLMTNNGSYRSTV